MNQSVEIRKARGSEIPAVFVLVAKVVHETCGHLFASDTPAPTNPEHWKDSWVAIVDDSIAGVALANENHVDDLWILREHRDQHIGTRLLENAESQISMAGYSTARLRVNAENESARRFYRARDWQDVRCYPHEKYGFDMVDMEKKLKY